jgi:molybdopterin/thiamine biosynthesis adenylyltransferase
LSDQHVLAWRRPRVKPEHAPYRISANRIRIGGPIYGTGSEIADPSGFIWALLQSLDGTGTIEEIISRFPDHRPAEVLGAFTQLANAGFIEDTGAPDPAELSIREKERYERSRRFFRWTDRTPRATYWEPQVRLRNARVVVVGLGGTGGTAALALAASGVGRLHCVDDDCVELSNLNRQIIYTEKDIGRLKTDAAAERLRALNSDIDVTTERLRVDDSGDIAGLAEDCDVLLLAADQPVRIHAWANRACLASTTPWVDGGYHGPRAAIGVYVPGQGPCYECVRLAEHDRNRVLGVVDDHTTARGDSNAVTATSAGISGHLAAHAVLALITGAMPVWPGRIHGVNLMAPDDQYVIDDPRREDCPACGSRT